MFERGEEEREGERGDREMEGGRKTERGGRKRERIKTEHSHS